MNVVLGILEDTVVYVLRTLLHNAPALVLGVMVAAAIQVYLDRDKMKNWLLRRSSVSIPATVVFGAVTPFCACGTMAVVLSMMATSLPWGPIMAFLTSSPLMSPEGFVLISGIISPTFAITLTIASIIIGLGAGYITTLIEKKTTFLQGQLRFADKEAPAAGGCGCGAPAGAAAAPASVSCCSEPAATGCGCGCGAQEEVEAVGCGCGALAMEPPVGVKPLGHFFAKTKIDQMLKAAFDVGVRKILPLFALFAGIGYLINRFIPSTWISAVFGTGNVLAVPLSALIGLPLYVNGDSAIPLIQSLMNNGVSAGAMLAFMITGPGTSAGVLAGIATIMKRKAIALYAAYLLGGAILIGYAYDLILAFVK